MTIVATWVPVLFAPTLRVVPVLMVVRRVLAGAVAYYVLAAIEFYSLLRST